MDPGWETAAGSNFLDVNTGVEYNNANIFGKEPFG